jgi:hypothetical protein
MGVGGDCGEWAYSAIVFRGLEGTALGDRSFAEKFFETRLRRV